MQLVQGKIQTIDAVSYMRQKGSSQAASTQKDWFYRLFYTQWFDDCQKAIKKVSEIVAHNENMNSEECYSVLYGHFVDRMRERYIPSDHHHFSKNIHVFGLPKRIIMALVSRIFNKIPFWGERYTQEFITKKSNLNKIEVLIKTVKRPSLF